MEKKKYSLHSSQLSNQKIAKCICGAEILIIDDVKKMVRAIEAHAQEHQRMEPKPDERKTVFRRVENFLTERVLEKVAFEGSGKE